MPDRVRQGSLQAFATVPANTWNPLRADKKTPTEKVGVLDIGGQGRNRTTDTRIFSPLLYRLSYLATTSRSLYRIFQKTYRTSVPSIRRNAASMGRELGLSAIYE